MWEIQMKFSDKSLRRIEESTKKSLSKVDKVVLKLKELGYDPKVQGAWLSLFVPDFSLIAYVSNRIPLL